MVLTMKFHHLIYWTLGILPVYIGIFPCGISGQTLKLESSFPNNYGTDNSDLLESISIESSPITVNEYSSSLEIPHNSANEMKQLKSVTVSSEISSSGVDVDLLYTSTKPLSKSLTSQYTASVLNSAQEKSIFPGQNNDDYFDTTYLTSSPIMNSYFMSLSEETTFSRKLRSKSSLSADMPIPVTSTISKSYSTMPSYTRTVSVSSKSQTRKYVSPVQRPFPAASVTTRLMPEKMNPKPQYVTRLPKTYRQGQYFVAIKSDDCPKIKVNKFDHELTKALSTLGVLNVSANIARTKCQTQLSINLTATAPYSAIQLLEQSRRHNVTITVFNRTFKIVTIQRLNPGPNDTDIFNTTETVVDVASRREFNSFVVVGSGFGLVLLVCITVCCMKCWSKDPNKRFNHLKSSHAPLNPEDYTLTPLPRPTSLYVDYYRNSFSGDTASAGSVGSTSPIGEKVVQPFDTSIVPLEDSTHSATTDNNRRNSVESAASEGRGKMSTIQTITNHALMYGNNSVADSREKLNPPFGRFVAESAAGVCNPTYQRF